MAGTRRGGIKAHKTIVERYGQESIIERGIKGGSAKVAKGFAKMSKEKLHEISKKGGSASRRRVDSTELRPRRPRVSDARWFI